jgi:hypothetical protein
LTVSWHWLAASGGAARASGVGGRKSLLGSQGRSVLPDCDYFYQPFRLTSLRRQSEGKKEECQQLTKKVEKGFILYTAKIILNIGKTALRPSDSAD